MKIANKITLFFFAAGVLLTGISATTFYLIAERNLRRTINGNLSAVLESRVNHIETYLAMLKISVGQLSRSVVLENFLRFQDTVNSEQKEAFELATRRLVNTRAANPSIAEFLLMNKAGTVVASSNRESIGEDKSTDSLFLGGQDDVFLKDVYFSAEYKEPLMAVSAPILDSKTGALLGVLAARVRMHDLNKIVMDRTGMGTTGEIYIVNKYGYMVTPSLFRENAVLTQKVDTVNARRAWLHKGRAHVIRRAELMDVTTDYRGKQVLGTHGYEPVMQWAVLAEMDTEEAFLALAKIRAVFLGILLVVPLVGLFVGMFVSGLVTGPLQILRKGMEIVGSGNLYHRVAMDGRDEVGQLSRSFDQMTQNLLKSMISVDNLNIQIAERMSAEALLRVSEERFRSFFEGSRDALMILEPPSWGFTGANQATVVMFKAKDVHEFISCGPWRFSPPFQPDGRASREKAVEMIETAMREGAHFFEWTHARTTGEAFPATVLLSRMDVGGKAFLQATVRDLTAFKQMEAALRESEFRFRTLIEQSSDIVTIIDVDGMVRYDSPSVERILGYAPEEVVGNNVFAYVHPDDHAVIKEAFARGMQSPGASALMQIRYRHKDGSWKVLECAGKSLANEAHIPEIMVNSRDVTERKRFEEALQKSAEEWSNTFDSISDLISIHDTEYRLIKVNKAFEDAIGMPAGQIIGRKCFELVHALDGPWPVCPCKQASHTGKPVTEEFFEPRLNQFIQVSVSPMFDAQGKVTGTVHIVRDITQRKKQEEQLAKAYHDLRQAQQELIQSSKMSAMGQLAAGVSHELNQPLTGIKGFAQAMRMDIEPTSPLLPDLERIIEQADRMDRIIKNVRFFARKAEFKTSLIDINKPLNAMVGFLRHQFQVSNIELVVSCAPALPSIQADVNQLEQVFLNLLTNARDAVVSRYPSEGGRVQIASGLTDDSRAIKITFADNGKGIPAEYVDQVFNPFFTTKSPNGGMGLGLAIVYRIVENHKGSIAVESKEGEGATFTMILPVA